MNDNSTNTTEGAAALPPIAEAAIHRYLDWLNLWHEGEEDMNGDGEPTRVTRAMCDEFDDPPRLLNDWTSPGHINRTMTIYVNPYHDEGGPTILTAFCSNYTNPSDPSHDANWTLDHIIQLFDTLAQFILSDGCLTNLPGAADSGEG